MNASSPQPPPTAGNAPLTLKAALAVAFLCMLFGANTVAIKVSLEGLGIFTAALIRFSIAAVAISLWALATGRPFRLGRGRIREMALISVIFSVQVSLMYWGISRTLASRATLLVNIQPFFVLVWAHFWLPDDRFTLRKMLGLLLAFGGVAAIVRDPAAIKAGITSGDLIMLGATLLWSFNAIAVKRIIGRYEPFHIVLYPMLAATAVFAVEAALWDVIPAGRIDGAVVVSLAYQSLVTASFGFVAWNHLLQRYGAVSVHSFLFILPVTGVLFSGLILGEPITLRILLSMGLIMIGLFVIHYRQRKTVETIPLSRNI
ncbi:MAG: DMT family transporter [Pseudomonadota bacterium]